MMMTRWFARCAVFSFLLAWVGSLPAFADGFNVGAASGFGILFEGTGGNTLQVSNVTVNGNVGVGLTGTATDSGPSTINGSINFSAGNTGQFSNNNASNVIMGGVNYNVAAVTNALNTVNALNIALGSEAGTNIAIGTGAGQTLTINASAGMLDANGNEVFNVTAFNTTNSNVLTINGNGHNVVLNFNGLSANFNNQVVLSGGLTPGQVLYNFVGGSNLTGGPTLQINDNLSNNTPNCSLGQFCVQGLFLDPNGPISVVNANVVGGVWGGDTHDFQYVSGSTLTASTTVPEPGSLVLLSSGLLSLLGAAVFRRKRNVEFAL